MIDLAPPYRALTFGFEVGYFGYVDRIYWEDEI